MLFVFNLITLRKWGKLVQVEFPWKLPGDRRVSVSSRIPSNYYGSDLFLDHYVLFGYDFLD